MINNITKAQPMTIDVYPQIVANPSSSRNANKGMHLSSYSFYFQDHSTPQKKAPFTKTLYMTKTSSSQARTLPSFFSMNNKLKGDRYKSNASKEKKHLISIVKNGQYSSLHEEKKKSLANFAILLTEADKVREIQSESLVQECVRLRLVSINRKVKMLKMINNYIYPYLLKAKEFSIKNDIVKMKAKNLLTKKKKMKMSLDSNHISIKDLYKQKQYHDKVYYYTNH